MVKVLDCTLRDGGYYTDWDFDKKLVSTYLRCMEKLPVDILEVGYRSPTIDAYRGEYFYLPPSTIQWIRENTSKQIAVMLNTKDMAGVDFSELLAPVKGLANIIRFAADPTKLDVVLEYATKVKALGFQVALNFMYLSIEESRVALIDRVKDAQVADCVYLVDSYGGLKPAIFREFLAEFVPKCERPVGFHAHNNLELAFANFLVAKEAGIEYVDSTLLGMGRGAGNLKTELLLTYLQEEEIDVDLVSLDQVLHKFRNLWEVHRWGTNLAYMNSGLFSLPQAQVMDMVSSKRYSLAGVVDTIKDTGDQGFDKLTCQSYQSAIVIGGGNSVVEHYEGIARFIEMRPECLVIFSSSRHMELFSDVHSKSFLCLAGDEINRVSRRKLEAYKSLVLAPSPRKTNVNQGHVQGLSLQELPSNQLSIDLDSPLAIGLGIAQQAKCEDVYLVGFDGYSGTGVREATLSQETQTVIDEFNSDGKLAIHSLTPTKYKRLGKRSVYEFLA